ncbi:DUF2510 domain-containing protein [Streptomyces sp. NBC_00842]|uniref:DUF2510 domain-containing protein n=1 Tax=unclassified Streptomyces TaxID=2593676 RepID=UPI003864DA46
MSDATPPGGMPDAAAPGTDRWWDGTAWTAHTRPDTAAPQQPVPPPYMGHGRSGGGGGGDGPPLSRMDTLTQGIRPIDDSETSGGVGSSVAP